MNELQSPFHIRVFRDGDACSYLLYDPVSRAALLVNPSVALLGEYRQALAEERLILADLLLSRDEPSPAAELLRGPGRPAATGKARAGVLQARQAGRLWIVTAPATVVFADGTDAPREDFDGVVSDTPVFPLRAGAGDALFTLWPEPLRGSEDQVTTLGVAKYRQKLHEGGPGSLFIDVRDSSEYAHSRIPGTVNVPAAELAFHLPRLRRCERVYVSCGQGRRSRVTAATLACAGVSGATSVEGGMQAWVQAGYPVDSEIINNIIG